MAWYDDDGQVVVYGVKSGGKASEEKKFSDPFKKEWEDVRLYRGIDPRFRRKVDREVKKAEKVPEGEKANSKQIVPQFVNSNGYGAFDVITPPYNLYELAQYYETSSTNHAAIDTKVANMVSLGYHWELSPAAVARMDTKRTEVQQAAGRRKIERAKVAMDMWLDNLNDEDTFTGTLEKVITDMQAVGNGYLEIGRKSNGQIGYIGHIPAMTMRVRRERDGFCQIIGNKVVFFANYSDDPSDWGYNPITNDPQPNQIVHFKVYSPLNTYYGVPDSVSAGQAMVGDSYANQYNIDYFLNKAVPRYIIKVKGAKLSADSEQKLFDFLQNNLRNQNHRSLLVPLPPDTDQSKVEFTMEAVENGPQEGSFQKYHESNRNDVLMAHQVPLSKIGLGDGSLAGTLASDRTFKEQVARPGQRFIEKKINRIIAELTDMLQFKLNELTLTDELAKSQIHEKYARSQILTPNEIRDELGKSPIDGGDKVIDLTSRQASNAANNARGDDERAVERENNASDGPTTVSGRNPKGEGRRQN